MDFCIIESLSGDVKATYTFKKKSLFAFGWTYFPFSSIQTVKWWKAKNGLNFFWGKMRTFHLWLWSVSGFCKTVKPLQHSLKERLTDDSSDRQHADLFWECSASKTLGHLETNLESLLGCVSSVGNTLEWTSLVHFTDACVSSASFVFLTVTLFDPSGSLLILKIQFLLHICMKPFSIWGKI